MLKIKFTEKIKKTIEDLKIYFPEIVLFIEVIWKMWLQPGRPHMK
jgi:hypothetical protein